MFSVIDNMYILIVPLDVQPMANALQNNVIQC